MNRAGRFVQWRVSGAPFDAQMKFHARARLDGGAQYAPLQGVAEPQPGRFVVGNSPARWLHEHGAKLVPGIVMGACETLNPAGLGFLADLGAPFTDNKGDRLAPLALVLETYGRNPKGKHAVIEIFTRQGYSLPDTAMPSNWLTP